MIEEITINPNTVRSLYIHSLKNAPALCIETDTDRFLFPLTTGFEIHVANEFLRSFSPDYYVFFRSWKQYIELVDLISADLKSA